MIECILCDYMGDNVIMIFNMQTIAALTGYFVYFCSETGTKIKLNHILFF